MVDVEDGFLTRHGLVRSVNFCADTVSNFSGSGWRITVKSFGFSVIGLAAFAAVLLSSVAGASSPDTPGTNYHVSAQAWAEAYYDFFPSHQLKTNSMLMLPQVWLFSPRGKMVRIASRDTDPKLEKFAAAFPDSIGDKALPKQPTSTQAHAFLEQVLSDQSLPAPKEGHWYAVLILLDRPAPHDCKQCANFEQTLRAVQTKHPNLLDTVRVTLVLNR